MGANPFQGELGKNGRPVSDSTFARENEVAMFLIGLFMGAIFGFAAAVILEAGKFPDLFTGE